MNSAINIYIPLVNMIDHTKIIRPQIGEKIYQQKYHPSINYNSTNSTSWNTFRQSNANHNRPNIYFKNEPIKQMLQSANINGCASKNIQIKFSYSNSMQSSCMKPMKISSLSSSRKRNKIFDSSYLYKQRNDSQNKLMRSNEENNKNINRVKLINSVQHKIQKQNSHNIIESPIKSFFMANSLQNKPQQTPFISSIPLTNQPRHFQIISHRQYNPQPQPHPKRITFNYQSNLYQKLHRINSNVSLQYQDKQIKSSKEYADLQYHKNYNYAPIENFDIKRKNNFRNQIKLKNAQQLKYSSSGQDNPSKNKIKKQFSLSKINRMDKVQQSEPKEYENPKFAKVIFQSQQIQQRNGQQSPNKNTKSRGLMRYNINKQEDQPSFIESISNQRYFDRSYPSILQEKKISYHNIEIQNAEDYLHEDRVNLHDNIFLGFQGQPYTVKPQFIQTIKTESRHIHQDQRKTIIHNIIQKDKKEIQESVSLKTIQNIPFSNKLSINEGKISLSLIAIAVLLFIIQLLS